MMRLRQTGMSMVEVLAAMVIFSAGAVILFGWISQVADRLGRLSIEQRQLFVGLAAVEYAKTINPMLQPSGVVQLPDNVTLNWTSKQEGRLENPRGALAIYEVALYRVDLVARRGSDATTDSVYLAGWRQVREMSNINPFGLPQ